jgi:xylose isomerase
MAETGMKLLWGTANLFSHRRYMAGAATNPDPDVFAYAAATGEGCMDVTHRLGGANYVLWGGREGYETLLNTDMKRELDQMGRFLSMVVEYKHRIGFEGTILIEPKPQEPTKHQYDYDVATVFGFLQRFGLEGEVKVNIETGHAVLAGHSFEHEIATASALGIFGSVDATGTTTSRAGTPTSSRTTCRRRRSRSTTSSRAAGSPPAASTSTPSCGGNRSTPTT